MKRFLVLAWLWPLLALADGMPDDPCGRPWQQWEEVIPYHRPQPEHAVDEPGVLWLVAAPALVLVGGAVGAWVRRRKRA